jgi:hypothetical protein
MLKLPHADAALLNAALIGLNSQLEGIDRQMAAVRAMLNSTADNPTEVGKPARKRKPMSPATKKRMALAQRKRWAAQRKAQKG